MGFSFNFNSIFVKKDIEYYESSNNIDFIIKLIRAKNIGANPNLRNYKGHTILYLLIHEGLSTSYLGGEDSEYKILLDKIKLLYKYGSNIKRKDNYGNTISHLLIDNYIKRNCNDNYERNLVEFLQDLGMTINEGKTAYDIGKMIIDSNFYRYEVIRIQYQLKLDTLLFREREIKFQSILNNSLIKK